MRPRGEIREALGAASLVLRAECRAATWRDLAECARVGYGAAKKTVENMASSGELIAVGTVRAAYARRPMVMYAPREAANFATGGPGSLEAAMRAWVR